MAEIGAAANFIALIGAGTKLSLVIFDLASRIGSAGTELEFLAKEISLFCAVTRQLQQLLSNASFKYSPAAIATAEEIVERCRKILDKIQDVVSGLLRMECPEGIPSMAFVSKVKWTFKKPKVEMMRSALESSKLTLQIMLSTMCFAQTLSQRRCSSPKTDAEDREGQIITRGLILSQQREIERLMRLEDAQERDASPETVRPPRNHLSLSETIHKDSSGKVSNRVSRLLKGLNPVSTSTTSFELGSPTSPQQQQQQQQQLDMPKAKAFSQPLPPSNEWRPRQPPPTRMERASAWLKIIIDANYQDPFNPHPGQPKKRLSSVETAELPFLLLKKWTDQADHLEALQKSSDAKHLNAQSVPGDSDVWDEHPEFNFRFPSPEEVARKSELGGKSQDDLANDVGYDDDDDDDVADNSEADDGEDEALGPNTILRPTKPEKRFNSNTKRSISFDQPARVPTDSLSPMSTALRHSIVASQMQRMPLTPLSPSVEPSALMAQEGSLKKTTSSPPTSTLQALSSQAEMFFNTAPSAFTTGKDSISLSPDPLPKVPHKTAVSDGGLSSSTAPTTSDSDENDDEYDEDGDGRETDTATDASSSTDVKPAKILSRRDAAAAAAVATSSSSRTRSVTRPLPFPSCTSAILTSPNELVDDIDNDMIDSTPSHEVLSHLLRMHGLDPPSSRLQYKLKVVYGGQQKTFTAHDTPLKLVRKFDEIGLRPILLLEKTT